ncbi:MAG TPA: O-acetyl-ADP-ribose deacetylase [Spirochaetota bacterium]|nr:O-acetyl-ADP-ribose deacetylase [Spirochaetota bacterium]HPJ33272.1 O-acetyl-ADP-ribose deacetylase [Spirochaetota bacterium]
MEKTDALNKVSVTKGDITKIKCDAIVNAANPSLLGGGGVDGAIHRAAGPGLLEECRKLGGCRHGEARITAGYNLPAGHVIHTPGPIYNDGKHGEPDTLRSSYYNSMKLAKDNALKSIAFPAISTGVYGYPKKEGAEIAIKTVVDFMIDENYLIDVIFVQFDNENYEIYTKLLEGMKNELS